MLCSSIIPPISRFGSGTPAVFYDGNFGLAEQYFQDAVEKSRQMMSPAWVLGWL